MEIDIDFKNALLQRQCSKIGVKHIAIEWYDICDDYVLGIVNKNDVFTFVLATANVNHVSHHITLTSMLSFGEKHAYWQNIKFQESSHNRYKIIHFHDYWKVLDYLLHIKKDVYQFGGICPNALFISKQWNNVYEMAISLDLTNV